MDLLAKQFELYSMRNMFLSFSQYSACLTAGCLPEKSPVRENLMNLYSRISLCRTVIRSLDYAGCLSRVRKYGLGRNDTDSPSVQRCLTLMNHLCDLIYYPCEFIAWLCEGNILGRNRSSRSFRLVSTSCWLANIIVSTITHILKLIECRRLLRAKQNKTDQPFNSKLIFIDLYKCLLSLLYNLCFLINCIHWLPIPGFLWSNKLPVFVVGLCGTVANLSNFLKLMI